MESDVQLGPLPVSQVTLVFIDVETTGLRPDLDDRVCEMALIRQPGRYRPAEWSTLIDPQRPLSEGAFAVNGITPEMLVGAPTYADVADHVDAALADAVYVAHNAPFDLGFLRAEYARLGRVFPERPTIDTVALARRYLRLPSHRLGALARHFRIPDPDAHRALGDCRTTRAVLAAIIRRVFPDSDPTVAELTSVTQSFSSRRTGMVEPVLPPSLAEMIATQRPIEIVYLSADGSRTHRSILVRDTVRVGRHMYLVADCLLRHEERRFRLDRIIDWNLRE
ncbi:MAG: exonuclease domain-containing protein [Candidatus Zixiibacteriota bacterium]